MQRFKFNPMVFDITEIGNVGVQINDCISSYLFVCIFTFLQKDVYTTRTQQNSQYVNMSC